MPKKHFHFFLFISIVGLQLYKLAAQPHCHFKHYSTEDGLPQYTIMDIMQDKNGLMWFATWDGLSKFDGYEFKNYKTIPGDSYYMKSNRIERIYEDGFSRIWLNTYDGDYHCFNPATHKFWGLQLVKDPKIKHKKPSGIFIVKSGNVWLPIKNSGVILIKKSVTDYELFDTESGKIKGENIYSIIEDSEQNNWLLTNNGITLVYANNSETKSFFYENNDDKSREMQHFFAALEVNKQIYFGSQNGHVWVYNKTNAKFD
ncbi:MAG: two-component regulator propeller domain-containing protein, partial [Prevotella sp.]